MNESTYNAENFLFWLEWITIAILGALIIGGLIQMIFFGKKLSDLFSGDDDAVQKLSENFSGFSTLIEVLTCSVIAIMGGMHPSTALSRYIMLGLIEISTSLIFSKQVSNAWKDGVVTRWEYVGIFFTGFLAFMSTGAIMLAYFESIGAFKMHFYGGIWPWTWRFYNEVQEPVHFNMVVLIMIWCTQFFNGVTIYYMWKNGSAGKLDGGGEEEDEDESEDEDDELTFEKALDIICEVYNVSLASLIANIEDYVLEHDNYPAQEDRIRKDLATVVITNVQKIEDKKKEILAYEDELERVRNNLSRLRIQKQRAGGATPAINTQITQFERKEKDLLADLDVAKADDVRAIKKFKVVLSDPNRLGILPD
jgi:hypothetical protein